MITIEVNGSVYESFDYEALCNKLGSETVDLAVKEQRWAEIRLRRDGLIEDTDSTYLRHQRELRLGKLVDDADNPTTLSSVQLAELDTYVQALADIPQTYDSPDKVVWPEKPSI